MIGTSNGFYSTSQPTFLSDDTNADSEITGENSDQSSRRHSSSFPSSPVEDRKYFSSFSSSDSMVNCSTYNSGSKEQKSYGWPSYNVPLNYSTYDDNENVTNAPLNLSLNGNDSLEPEVVKHATPQLLSLPNSKSVAQFILTSGQMVQGIQGAQLFVPTSQGLAKQIVLTIPITHVTTDQVINLSLTDGQIIPTTVGELLKLAMPKNMFEDDVTGEKIINELMKFSEQTSLYIAEYMKIALEHSKKYYNEKRKSESKESESGSENKVEDEKVPIKREEESTPEPKLTDTQITNAKKSAEETNSSIHNDSKNSTHSRRRNSIVNSAENSSHHDPNATTLKHKSLKRVHDSHVYNDVRSHKTTNNHRLHSDFPMHLFNTERPDKTIASTTVTREEPTSTMNHEENGLKFDSNFRQEQGSPTNSYDENDLDEIKEFAKSFKLRRLSMGLTQTQVGQALNITEGPAYSQSAICSALASHVYAAQIASQQHSIFEKLDITPKSAQKIKPVLERWMKEAEERYRNGQGLLTEFIGMESSKKRKRRTSFTPQALEILNSHFEHNTHPSGTEITALAHQLGYDREVIRIWFCNKRQALKNTVRMMSKHIM